MTNPRTILVIADRRMEMTPALNQAAELAHRCRASLHLCLFDYAPIQDTPDPEEFIRVRNEWIEQRLAEFRARGITADGEYVATMDPASALLAKAIQYEPDLVVRDLHPLAGVEWLEFRPDEKEFVELCPAPMLMVRPGSTGLPRVVLAAVTADNAPESQPLRKAIVEAARDLGAAIGAQVHLAHVCPHQVPGGEGLGMLRAAAAASREADREQFERFARDCGLADGFFHWIEGKPADAVADFANELGAGWLVIGSQHHSLLAQFRIELIGSKTDHMVGRTRCDVLFVKAPGFLADLDRRVDIDAVSRQYAPVRRHAA